MLALFLLIVAALTATILLHRRFPAYDFLFLDIPIVGLVTYVGGRLAGYAAALLAIAVASYSITPRGSSLQMGRDLLLVDALFAVAALGMVAAGNRLRAAAHGQQLASIHWHRFRAWRGSVCRRWPIGAPWTSWTKAVPSGPWPWRIKIL